MDGTYEVFQDAKAVGRIEVVREGLYYRITCQCCPMGREMLRLWMICGEVEMDLGLCVPKGDGFGTQRRISVKQCGSGEPKFILRSREKQRQGTFVPLRPEEPFRYIHRLENAFMERRGGEAGIVIPL